MVVVVVVVVVEVVDVEVVVVVVVVEIVAVVVVVVVLAPVVVLVVVSLSLLHSQQTRLLLNYKPSSPIDPLDPVRGESSNHFLECVCSPCSQQFFRLIRTPQRLTKCSLRACGK